jgi:hypothetical protein
MRPPIAIALLALGPAVLGGGCGKQEASTPETCLEGPSAYVQALDGAPAEVTLADDETQIGDCLAENQESGDLATVGEAMVAAATQLNAEARAEPGGDANVELGYLLGAAQRAAEETEGIHAELVRRLAVAARYSPGGKPLPPSFMAAYQRGFDAGQDHG